MKTLNLFKKNVIYTFSVLLIVIIIIHVLFFTMIPQVYLGNKRSELERITNELTEILENEDDKKVLNFAQNFAYATNTNVRLSLDEKEYTFFGLMNLDIKFDENLRPEEIESIQSNLFIQTPGILDQVGVILSNNSYRNQEGYKNNLQVMMSIQPVHEIRAVTLQFFPYSLMISLIISALSAYFYSKKMTQPILELLKITDQMAKFDREAHFNTKSQDELAQLGTHINKMYDVLLQSIDELQFNLSHMEVMEHKKDVFFKAASHELRTPLTSLSVILENMMLNVYERTDYDFYLRKALDLVDVSNEKLKQILDVNDLVSYDHTVMESLNVYTMINKIIDHNKILIKEKDLTLTIKVEKDLEITSNEVILSQTVSNIIINAIQYSDQGSTIIIESEKSYLSIENACETAGELNIENLFEPFYRYDASRTKMTQGNGLGLYIVKKNLESLSLDFELEILKDSYTFVIKF